MLEHHLNSPVTWQRLRAGPAAEYVDGFDDWLHHHGYTSASRVALLRSLAGWTDWIILLSDVAQRTTVLFVAYDRCDRAGGIRWKL